MSSGNPSRGLGLDLKEHAQISESPHGKFVVKVPCSDFTGSGNSEEEAWAAFTEGYKARLSESEAEREALTRFIESYGRRRSPPGSESS